MSGDHDATGKSEEALLVLLTQSGDRDAFRSLVDRYDRRLLYFVRRIVNDEEDAYDVVQAVWLFVHRKLRSLRASQAFRVWIYRIAHDQAVAALRKRTRQPVVVDDTALETIVDDSEPDPNVDIERVHAALGALSVDHRRVLTLRFLEDMSIEDIAAVLRCNPGTIKSRLHYAKAALRQRIEELSHD
jgi:RNA polymerase sigma-70 factor (ECF subfamily)